MFHASSSSECFSIHFPFLWNLWINQYDYLISSDINNCFLQFSPIYIGIWLSAYGYQFLKRLLLHVWRVLIWIFCTFCFLLPFQILSATNIWTFIFSKIVISMFWLILTLLLLSFDQSKIYSSIGALNLLFSSIFLVVWIAFLSY